MELLCMGERGRVLDFRSTRRSIFERLAFLKETETAFSAQFPLVGFLIFKQGLLQIGFS
jgi:hypothetical protein